MRSACASLNGFLSPMRSWNNIQRSNYCKYTIQHRGGGSLLEKVPPHSFSFFATAVPTFASLETAKKTPKTATKNKLRSTFTFLPIMVAVSDSSRQRKPAKGNHEELHKVDLPKKLRDEFDKLEFFYPGWQKDHKAAQEALTSSSYAEFLRIFQRLKNKQQIYAEYKVHARLEALVALDLTFPEHGVEKDRLQLWLKESPASPEAEKIFRDKVEGLRNKERLFVGDRSHPHIQRLDQLHLTYPGWEIDYQKAVTAHCTTPGQSFLNHLHYLEQSEAQFLGDRSHWRLLELDGLTLSYPGWKEDVEDIEDWHLHAAETEENDEMFAEVIDSLKEQEELFRQEMEERKKNAEQDGERDGRRVRQRRRSKRHETRKP